MKLCKVWLVILMFAGIFATTLPAQEVAPEACENLAASLNLETATITSALAVTAGQFTHPSGAQELLNLPEFCRVQLTIAPTPDSDIRAELWLPMKEWNGKFLTVGNPAWGGSIQYKALANGLRQNYATASSDTGHTTVDATFAIGHPEKLIDFGYRAVHQTAVLGKAIIAGLYSTAPRFSYFNGCSGGGRQSFMEAQRYPEDFDAIIAGAPGYDRTDVAFQTLGMNQATHDTPESFIPAEKYSVIHNAAMSMCDAHDGLEDGLISNPVACDFDPGALQCKDDDAATCLTEPQVVAARKIYATIIDSRTGELLTAGLEPGSELHWGRVAGEKPHLMYLSLFQHVVYPDEEWDFRSMDVASHLDAARAADNGVLAAISPNLEPFFSRGGKLLIYHGWADQNIPPLGSVDYYQQVVETLGLPRTIQGMRLYMVPGMGHCGGGHGPNEFDMLDVLDKWRDQGQAPQAVVAELREDDNVVRSRPLCPYPQVAHYNGTGSIDEAGNFTCVVPVR
ncbi:MAG: tannase/feruloyl esterase family alpha/beta hydrolase [Arenicellaceae bacterium]|nr:tannase/feruloyl esterase family alpha/beta hydrolase [Arenicellaceae bacterium]